MPVPPVATIASYGLFVLKQIRWPLLVFSGMVLLGGLLFSNTMSQPYGKACFGMFMLMFAQPIMDFPSRWYDQVLFFLIPIVGLGAVADSVVRLGYLVFTSK